MFSVRIGLIGDYSPEVRAHQAIPQALALAAGDAAHSVTLDWLATTQLTDDVATRLSTYDGLWCVPGSPYASMDGALWAIRCARERAVPFLGTCAGFQHALIEYARDVLGLAEADHAESNPSAALPLIAPLTCSLVGQRGAVTLVAGSRIASIYGHTETVEAYHCNYGLDPRFRSLLETGALRVTGVDAEGAVRVVELEDHPFFVATLFQPELSAFAGTAHPLIRAFFRAAQARSVSLVGQQTSGLA
jgi:CTP synthase (UTP-ammonia lyase)